MVMSSAEMVTETAETVQQSDEREFGEMLQRVAVCTGPRVGERT